MNMTVRKKLLFGFSTVLLLFAIVIGITYYQFNQVNHDYYEMVKDRSKKIILVSELSTITKNQQLEFRGFLATNDEARLAAFYENMKQYEQKVGELRSVSNQREVLELIDKLDATVETYQQAVDKAIQYERQNDREKSLQLAAQEGGPAVSQISMLLDELLAYQENNIAVSTEQLSSQTKVVTNSIVIFGIIGVIIGLIIALYISNMISKPVQAIANSAKEIADGYLTSEEIQIKNKDEIGQLATAFNQMKGQLRTVLRQVGTASDQVAASAEQLMASTEQTTSATNQVVMSMQEVAQTIDIQGKNMEESAQAMEGITTGTQSIADSALRVAESVSETTKQANTGNEYIQKVAGQMEYISQASEGTKTMMDELERRSNEIGHIIDVITGIADQTNLLALNAAIESARAGENGKGFAVVADEVRKLAEQSRQSAYQIAEIIQLIQADTNKAAEMTAKGNEEVQSGLKLVEETGATFENILKSIEGVNAQTQELSAISEEMAASVEQVNAAIEEVSQLSKESSRYTAEIAASSEEQLAIQEEISSSATSLSGMAEELRETMNKFKI